jgi:uncharacterized protein (DUF488 family)
MFYRRKIILGLLQAWGGTLDKISLQKLLFLFSREQTQPVYEFVPYRFGCYSFSVNADLNAMQRQSLIEESNTSISKLDKRNYVAMLTPADKQILLQLRSRFGTFTVKALMKYVYRSYGYYATRSEKAKELLSRDEYRAVRDALPWCNKHVLFTIGYEGISLEAYLNKLLRNDIRVLCDVRKNPISMKFGFSKESLERYCRTLDIHYVHLPLLGIASDLRKHLSTQSDYDKLFEIYRTTTLRSTSDEQQKVINLLHQHKRVALTCFEAELCRCHRKPLADAIFTNAGSGFELLHI